MSKSAPSTFKNNRQVSKNSQIKYWKNHWRAGTLRLVERILTGTNVSESLGGNSTQILHLPVVQDLIQNISLIQNGEVVEPLTVTLNSGINFQITGVRQPVFKLLLTNVQISLLDGSVWLSNGFTLDAILPAWQTLIYSGGISDSLSLSKQKNKYFDGDWVVLSKSNYFYHQLIEDLPNLLIALGENEKTGIIISTEAQPAIIQMLNLLPNKIILTDLKMVKVERLHAITSARMFSEIEGNELRNFAKRYILSNTISQPRKRFFISRGPLNRGDAELEEKIFEKLERKGFDKIFPDQLDITEQIILFSQAEVILSLHGGALANMVWMPSHSKVVEIFNHEYRTYDFLRMAHGLGHEYKSLDFANTALNKQEMAESLISNLGSFLD